jgi:hypothetical protein
LISRWGRTKTAYTNARRLIRLNIVCFGLILFLISHSSVFAKQDGVPHFDIEHTCRAARSYAGADKEVAYKGCLKDEADAREQLAQKWTSFKSADRSDCVLQGSEPMPSYVELLTCLEMSAEVGVLNAPNGARGNKALGSVRQNPLGLGQGGPPSGTPAPTPEMPVPTPENGGLGSGPIN